jgi:hypothetical protein
MAKGGTPAGLGRHVDAELVKWKVMDRTGSSAGD